MSGASGLERIVSYYAVTCVKQPTRAVNKHEHSQVPESPRSEVVA